MIKSLLALSLLATPTLANTIDDHNLLLQNVERTGVVVKINPDECDSKTQKYYGWYSAFRRELVICQENKLWGSQQQVMWTLEDFDTVRHEAHHVVQDCMDNSLNGRLDQVYKEPLRFAVNTLTQDKIKWIIHNYAERGEHIVMMEIEAFSVAQVNDPLEQVRDINTYCF